MKKWNYKTKEYEPYKGPKNSMLYSDNMDVECECAKCGKKMKFGDGYTSDEIYNDSGMFGYCICEDCKNEEYLIQEAINNGR